VQEDPNYVFLWFQTKTVSNMFTEYTFTPFCLTLFLCTDACWCDENIHSVSKKLCIFVSVRTLSNFHEFWCVDGKVAEIVCYAYIFHLTWLTSLHYLVKLERSKFYLTPDLLESDCSDVMSKWRRHTVATTFFLRSPC